MFKVRHALVGFALAAALIPQSVLPAYSVEEKSKRSEGDSPSVKEPLPASTKESSHKTGAKGHKTADWNKLCSVFEAIVVEYYPKAKIEKKDHSLHATFKTKSWEIPGSNRHEEAPVWGGILLDVDLKEGQYAGVQSVPAKLNYNSYYHVLMFAPYSKEYGCHLLTKVAHPFDAPPEFLKRVQNLVNQFEQYL
ncbi:MAG TPA: hypothetical protein V6D17_05540 [Candidatus Obscuribacterales bacterium]